MSLQGVDSEQKRIQSDTGAERVPGSAGRRSFLGIVIGAVSAAIATILAVTIGRYTIEPSLKAAADSDWVEVGLVEDVPDGQWVKRNVVVSQDSGWGEFNTQRPIWVLKKGSAITAFTGTCPHLGCTINAAPSGGFICPCHGSAWNGNGVKLGGPAPRNMDTLDIRLQDDHIQVKYQYFKQGIAEKVPMA